LSILSFLGGIPSWATSEQWQRTVTQSRDEEPLVIYFYNSAPEREFEVKIRSQISCEGLRTARRK
jgi:hypothetical protein